MKKRILALLLIAAMLLSVLVSCGAPHGDDSGSSKIEKSDDNKPKKPKKDPEALTEVNQREKMDGEEIYEKCSPAVFFIMADRGNDSYMTGTGFFIGENGLALTNQHVMEGAKAATATTTDGKEHKIEGVVDYVSVQDRDYALIKVRGSGYPTLPLGDSQAVQGGEVIYTIGNPKGMRNTISDGLVANPSQPAPGGAYSVNVIQITAPISPGNSGGPLLNAYGEVLGINSAFYASDDAQNINFVMPIHAIGTLEELVAKYKKNGVTSMRDYYAATTEKPKQPQSEAQYTSQQAAYYALRQAILSASSDGVWSDTVSGTGVQIEYRYTYQEAQEYITLAAILYYDDGSAVGLSIGVVPQGYQTVGMASYAANNAASVDFVGCAVVDAATFNKDYEYQFFQTEGEIYDEAVFAENIKLATLGLLQYLDRDLKQMGYSVADFGFVNLYN